MQRNISLLGLLFIFALLATVRADVRIPPVPPVPPVPSVPPVPPVPVPPAALADQQLDVAQLKDWGTRTYDYKMRNNAGEQQSVGQVVMKTQVKDGEIILADTWKTEWRGRKQEADMQLTCQPDATLTPKSIRCRGQGDDQMGNFDLQVKEAKATVTPTDGTTQELDWPARVLSDAGLYRVLTLLPSTPGVSYTVPSWLEVSELNFKKDHTLTCVGPETIQIAGQDVACTRWEHTGEGIMAAHAWVDEHHVLRRFVMDGRKTLELVSATGSK